MVQEYACDNLDIMERPWERPVVVGVTGTGSVAIVALKALQWHATGPWLAWLIGSAAIAFILALLLGIKFIGMTLHRPLAVRLLGLAACMGTFLVFALIYDWVTSVNHWPPGSLIVAPMILGLIVGKTYWKVVQKPQADGIERGSF